MKESVEKSYHASEGQKTKEEFVSEKIAEIESKYEKPIAEVLEERRKTLDLIAKIVGSDFGMKIVFGEMGSGSYFSPEDKNVPREEWNSITLDPLILAEFEGIDEFVAAHEGAHRAITRTLEQVGIKTEKERGKYAEKIGWGFTYNALEDPAVNNWVGSLYQRIAEILEKNYEEQFKEENATMSTPQIQELTATLGYVPNFVRYGSEMMRHWHKKSFSADLPPEINEALEITKLAAEKFWSEVPSAHPTEKDVLKRAKTRWQIYEKGIWPLVEKLIEKDKVDEKLKQYWKEQIQKAIEEISHEAQKTVGEPQVSESGKEQSLEDIMEQFGFDEKEKQEMREKMEEAAKRQKEHQQNLKEKLEKGEISQEEFDKQTQETQRDMPLDMKSLSESTKKKMGEKLSQESKETQEQIEKKAKESLEKAEDKINEDIQGKIGPKEKSHQERKEWQAKESEKSKREAQKIAEELTEKQKQKAEFEKWQKEQEAKRTAWEKAVSEQAKTIDELYQLIEDLFRKKKHPRWEKGFSAGQRLDLKAAMQYEADPRNYTRLWEKKTIPEKYDYRFAVANDQSGSMNDEKKSKNKLMGNAQIGEVLAAINVPNAIFGYSDSFEDTVKQYKGFNEDLNEERQQLSNELSKIASENNGGTPTHKATQIISEILSLERQQTKHHAHFLLVVTDGEPTDCTVQELKSLNERLSKENEQIIIGVGIGEGISEENLKITYGGDRYVYAKNPEEFPKKMAALLEAIFTQSQKKG